MENIRRTLEPRIQEALKNNKVTIVYGARRVGKTTLVKAIVDKTPNAKYFNCELLQNKELLETTNSEMLYSVIGNYNLVVFDEAQTVENIGQILKILHDTFPEISIIATGSSSFYLKQQSGEPLTGRSRTYEMMPLSFQEIVEHQDLVTVNAKIESILRFGLYPEVFNRTAEYAMEELEQIASNYLYKDILQFERLKKPELLYNLLKALAFQIGSEVSLNEISNTLQVHVNTIKRYIELLEESYVLFRLSSYSQNPRNEIGKSQKIFFYDLGIRNAVIHNFNPLGLRNDVGQLWENFIVAERRKLLNNKTAQSSPYFWRNYQKQEIDYLEEETDGKLNLFECKYNPSKQTTAPTDFKRNYTNYEFNVVNKENYWTFLLPKKHS
jgi:hypothetical protein